MTTIDSVMHRIKNLQEFEVQVTKPDHFEFRGAVPFDMKIYGDQMFITVWAVTLEEAIDRVNRYLDGEEE